MFSSSHNKKIFFDIIKPRRIEHLQSEEPFSSDPYFCNGIHFNFDKHSLLNSCRLKRFRFKKFLFWKNFLRCFGSKTKIIKGIFWDKNYLQQMKIDSMIKKKCLNIAYQLEFSKKVGMGKTIWINKRIPVFIWQTIPNILDQYKCIQFRFYGFFLNLTYQSPCMTSTF